MTSNTHSSSDNGTCSPHIQTIQGTTNLLSANLLSASDVQKALRLWHKEGSAPSPLAPLYLFQRLQQRENSSNRHAANSILQQALAILATENAEYEWILRSRYLDQKIVDQVANELNIADSTLFSYQSEAIALLTRIILDMEEGATQEHCDLLLHSLELPPDTHLIGIDRHLEELGPKLAESGPPLILSIEGIGGIGKTTLADAVVRHAVRTDTSWEQIAWVTARQNELLPTGTIGMIDGVALTVEALLDQLYEKLLPEIPRHASFDSERVLATLKQHLQKHKCLVVIDNLETIQDVDTLIPTLRQLTSKSKFILTSRESLYDARDVYHYQIPELIEAEALALVRHEAEASNLPHVVAASDDELRPIYKTVGGNPLALRLVTGQLHIHGLQEILGDLTEARTETAENLYTFIYRKAWDHLDEPARRALIAMILVDKTGDTIDDLLKTCRDLKRSELRMALNQLVTLNLVDSLGNLNERRYSIHNLTRSFLHKQVVLWE